MNNYKEYAKCSANIDYFAGKYLKLFLTDGQKQIIAAIEQNKNGPIIQERISGKTTAIACYFTHSLIFKEKFRGAAAAPKKIMSDSIISQVKQMIGNVFETFPVKVISNSSSIKCDDNILYSIGMNHSYIRGNHLDKFVVDESEFVNDLNDLIAGVAPALISSCGYTLVSSSKSHDAIEELSFV